MIEESKTKTAAPVSDVPTTSTVCKYEVEEHSMEVYSARRKNVNNSKEIQKKVKKCYSSEEEQEDGDEGADKKQEPIDQEQLLLNMREEHNLKFKSGILVGLRADDNIKVFFNIYLDIKFFYFRN